MGEYIHNGVSWDPIVESSPHRAPWRSQDAKALCCPSCYGTALTLKGVAANDPNMRYLCHGCGEYFRAPRTKKLHILD